MNVVKANVDDLKEIVRWLKLEYDQDDGEGFWSHRNTIGKAQEEGSLWAIHVDQRPVAFQVGNYSADLACVQKKYQRRGLGTELFKASVARANKDNVTVLTGECSPPTSWPFWKAVGFKLVSGASDLEFEGFADVYRVNHRSFVVPEGTPKVRVEAVLYPAKVLIDKGLDSFQSVAVTGAKLANGEVALSERIIVPLFFNPPGDHVVKVTVEDEIFYFDKTKYSEAKEMGINHDREGQAIYIDKLFC